ncbi:MAG: DUF3105 domain-containing protein [Actinomycetota bacterium]
MAKRKKKKKRAYTPPETAEGEAVETKVAPKKEGPPSERRERKEEVRRRKEKELKSWQRKNMLRRGIRYAVILGGIAAVTVFFLNRRQAAEEAQGRLEKEAAAAATAAGCTDVENREDLGGNHLTANEPFDYPDRPPTSGPHDPGPLPADPHVYNELMQETRAVHNLEHGFVVIYYRDEGKGALPENVVKALEPVARDSYKVIMAPYDGLQEGNALALTGWNRRQQCPSKVDADQATTIARSFIQRFTGNGVDSVAPEKDIPA